MIFSEMTASFIDIDLRTNDHFDFSVYYVYLDKDFMNVKLYGNYEKLSQETVRDLLNKPNNFFLLKSFNDIKLFRVISQNKGFAIIYLLHIKPLSKTVIISWITFNIILILLLFILCEKFIFIVRKKIENPLREIKNYVNESKPYQYVGDIAELKDLAETYEHHLEKTKTRDFLKEVLKAQEQERERIARDIHDIVIQNLNYILIRLNQNNQKELAELLKSQIQELRNMVIDGDLVIFKKLGIEKFFEIFIADYSQKNPNFKFYYENNFHNFSYFEKYEQINILRIARELINNAVKHSKGSSIEIRFFEKDNQLNIQVKDNGIGFEMMDINIKKGFGLNSVFERVFILGGKIDIKSSKSGTVVLVEIPINK